MSQLQPPLWEAFQKTNTKNSKNSKNRRENEEESTSPVLFLLVLFTNLLLQFFPTSACCFPSICDFLCTTGCFILLCFTCCSFASPVLNNRATSAIQRAQCAVFFFFLYLTLPALCVLCVQQLRHATLLHHMPLQPSTIL